MHPLTGVSRPLASVQPQSCTHAAAHMLNQAHPHAQHTTHSLAARKHARAAAAAQQQQQQQQQRQWRRQQQQQQRHYKHSAMDDIDSNQHLHFSSIQGGNASVRPACHWLSQKTRRFRMRSLPAPSASRARFHSRGSQRQIMCAMLCVVLVPTFQTCVMAKLTSGQCQQMGQFGQLHQPEFIRMAVCSAHPIHA